MEICKKIFQPLTFKFYNHTYNLFLDLYRWNTAGLGDSNTS